MLKRFLSLMLVFVMVISLLPAQALAEGTPETEAEQTVQESQIPETVPETVPVTESVTEPATEPATEPVTVPATEPETEPVTVPATEPEETTEAPGVAPVADDNNEGGETEYPVGPAPDETADAQIDSLSVIKWTCNGATTYWTYGREFTKGDIVQSEDGSYTRDLTMSAVMFNARVSGHMGMYNEEHWHDHTAPAGIPTNGITITLTWDSANQQWTSDLIEYVYTCNEAIKITPAASLNGSQYSTVQRAINFATANETVKLEADCAESLQIVYKSNVTLNLNGYDMMSGSSITLQNSIVRFEGDGQVLGDINLEDFVDDIATTAYIVSGTYKGTISVGNGCNLIVAGGTFSQDVTAYVQEGSVCRNNGDGTWTVTKEAAEPSVTFTFNLPSEGSMEPITVQIGEELVLPECTVENPGFAFSGWDIGRSDGAWLSVDGTFSTVNSREYKPGDKILITADLFDEETYDYHIGSLWRQVSGEVQVYFHVWDQSIVRTVTIGETFAVPECDVEIPGYRFEYWYMQRDDGLVLNADGEFVENYNAEFQPFYPGDEIDTSEPGFDFVDYHYYFVAWLTRDNSSGNVIDVFFDEGNSMSWTTAAAGGTVAIPRNTQANPGHEFAGWFLSRPDGAWLAEDGTFTLDESVAARCFVPGDEFTVTEDMLSNQQLTFHAIWKDAVTIESYYGECATVKYGEEYVFPAAPEEMVPDDGTFYWGILRSDDTVLTPDGTFQDMRTGWWETYESDASVVIDADIFDGTKYTYSLGTIVHSNSGGGSSEDSQAYVSDEAGLRAAMEAGFSDISIEADITLSEDLKIYKDYNLYIQPSATLTVPSGITLTVEGSLYIDGGTVKVAPGGAIEIVNNQGWIGVWSGTLDVTGADISGLDLDRVGIDGSGGAQVLGVPSTSLDIIFRINNMAELKEAVARADQYKRVELDIYGAVTITEDLDIPENVMILLWHSYAPNGDIIPTELTIASGVSITARGNLQVGNNSILNVAENAQLTVCGYFSVNSTSKIVNNGTISYSKNNHRFDDGYTYEGTGEMNGIKAPGMTEAQLRAALNSEETWIFFDGNITLTDDLVIPLGYDICLAEEASIDVPEGFTLNVEGSLSIQDGIVKVAPGASLIILESDMGGYITVGLNGHLDVTGADLSGAILHRINLSLSGNGKVSGIPSTEHWANIEVTTLADAREKLALASQYYYLEVSFRGEGTIEENLKVATNANFWIIPEWGWDDESKTSYPMTPSSVTVASGVIVENHGYIHVNKGCTLTLSEGSELYCPGNMYINATGTLINNGTIYARDGGISSHKNATIKGSGKRLPYEAPPLTEDELHEELQYNGSYVELTGDLTLTRNLTVPENNRLAIEKGAVLTVPAGKTLTIDGTLYIDDGVVKVEEGGILKVTGDGMPQVAVFDGGTLDVTGTDISGIAKGSVYFWLPYNNILGIPAKNLSVADYATSKNLNSLMEQADQYHAVYAECYNSMTISKDVYIPQNVIMEIIPRTSSTGAVTPTKVTVSSGATVENDGVIYMYPDTTLTVNSGCELYNLMGILEVYSDATLVNNGTVTIHREYLYLDENAAVKGTGRLRVIDELEDSSLEEILAAYENGSTVLRVVKSDIKFTESIELPDDLELEFIESDVTIPENVTVTCNTNRAWSLQAGSNLYLNGTFNGKELFMDNGSAVIPEEKIVSKVKADVGGWYIKLGLPKVTGLTIHEIVGEERTEPELDVDMKCKPTVQLGVTAEPQYASEEVTWKSNNTGVATVSTTGLVTFKKPGAVTITATAADGSKVSTSVKFNVTYLDPATKLTAAVQVPEQGLETSYVTTMLVYGADKEHALDPANLTFTIPASQKDIASVDEKTGVITAGTKAGTATVTAAIDGDPLGRKVSVKVKVIPLQTESLYLIPEDGELGRAEIVLLNADSDEMPRYEVYLDHTEVVSADYTFVVRPVAISTKGDEMELTASSLEWASTDMKVATVKANADGSATVTLKADGVSVLTATTTDLAARSWEVSVYVRDESPRLDTNSVSLNTNMTTGVKIPLVESYGNTVAYVSIEDDRLNTSYENGMLTITANDFIDMRGTIQTKLFVTCENDHTYTYNISVKIANSLPSISVKQPEKFNIYTGLDAELIFTAKDVAVTNVVLDTASTESFDQTADFDPATGILHLEASDAHISGNTKMNNKIRVEIELDGYRERISMIVTVTTSSSKPSITVKQPDKFNLFYSDWEAQLQISAKDMEYDRVELTDTDSFELVDSFDFAGSTLTVKMTDKYLDGEVKLDTSAKLLLYPVGYETPIVKAFSIATATIKPNLILTPTSSTINVKLEDKTTFIAVNDKTYGPTVLEPEDVDITVTKDFATYEVVDGGIKLALNGEAGGTATIKVQLSNWTQPITLKHTVKVQTALPTPVLGASTLKLNRIFTEETADTTAALNQSNYKISGIVFTPVTKGAENIELSYDPATGIITASFKEDMAPADAPRNGNYKFDYVVTLDNAAATTLAKKTITVNVSATVPTAKLKTSTLMLNKNMGTLAAAQTTVSLTKGDGYKLVGLVPRDEISGDIEVVFDPETGVISAYLMSAEATAKNHAVYLYPVLLNEETGQAVQLTSTVKLTVAVKAQAISASISAKGKLDTMDPDSAITYTVNKLNNVVGDVYDVTLVDDLGLFDVELDTSGSKPVAKLTRKAGAEVSTNTTYKLQLRFSIWVNTSEGLQTCDVVTSISFKVSQSALKFVTIPTQKLYLFQKELVTTVALSTPVTAKLYNVELNSKSAAAFKWAMGDGEATFELSEDGRSADVHFAIEHPGYLVNGRSYTVYLDVTPADNATNVKPTTVKLTVKAYK